MLETFGFNELIDVSEFTRLVLRLTIDLAFALVVIRLVHYRLYRNRDLAFTYLLFNVITFTLCFMLRKVPIELGFALGLFAVFGILRYRTEPIRTRDLTYLFVVIGLAILNAVANEKVSFAELFLINAVIAGLAGLMNIGRKGKQEQTHQVIYDNLSLLGPDRREALLQDLSARTGLEVTWVEVGDLDLLRDTARLTITCETERRPSHARADEQSDPCHGGHDADLAVPALRGSRG